MNDLPKSEKPKTVLHAELALWVWTAWICLFGFYRTRNQLPDIEQAMDAADLQNLISLSHGTLLPLTIAGYVLLALVSAWVIMKIGSGKHWARSSLLWGFLFQIFFAAFPPYESAEMLATIPDLGLQIYALYLLYTAPGSGWFRTKKSGV